MNAFTVIFDNGGGITLQTRNYATSFDTAAHAGKCIAEILAGADPYADDWDGHDPELLAFDFSSQTEAEMFSGGEIAAIVAAGEHTNCKGYAERDFWLALGIRCEYGA